MLSGVVQVGLLATTTLSQEPDFGARVYSGGSCSQEKAEMVREKRIGRN